MSVGQLQVLLVGPVRLLRDELAVPLPRSRKVLALLAYLALDGTQQSRTRLCDLLWDGPNDPRGELRWCLSKLRALVDDADRRRVVADGNTLVRLDLSDVPFDVRSIDASAKAGIAHLTTEQLVSTLALFRGDLLEGLELDGTPELSAWLAARRQSYRSLRRTIAQELARRPSTRPDAAERHQESRRSQGLARARALRAPRARGPAGAPGSSRAQERGRRTPGSHHPRLRARRPRLGPPARLVAPAVVRSAADQRPGRAGRAGPGTPRSGSGRAPR